MTPGKKTAVTDPDPLLDAIRRTPADRTLRLAYADWLEERDDPRYELVRVCEAMRDVPVYSDRYWALKARRNDKSQSNVDVDEFEQAENLELPGADLSNEELSFRVIPRQADEFTCSRCFLVHHRSQLAEDRNGQPVALETAPIYVAKHNINIGDPIDAAEALRAE